MERDERRGEQRPGVPSVCMANPIAGGNVPPPMVPAANCTPTALGVVAAPTRAGVNAISTGMNTESPSPRSGSATSAAMVGGSNQ